MLSDLKYYKDKSVPENNSKLAAIIITKNEEAEIERCITSLSFVDEIIIVDDLSTDKTIELARKKGAKVFSRKLDNFSAQRNFGVDQTDATWIFNLDADLEVTPKLAQEIQQVIREGKFAAFKVPHLQFIFKKPIIHGGWYPAYVPRLYNRHLAFWSKLIHEQLEVKGKMGTLSGDLLHHTHETVGQFIETINRYTDLEAQSRLNFCEKASILKLLTAPIRTLVWRFVVLAGWRDGWVGFLLAGLMAFYKFAYLAKLRFLQQKPEQVSNSP